jgi:WD40 repeat protein
VQVGSPHEGFKTAAIKGLNTRVKRRKEEIMFLAAGENECVKLFDTGSYELIKSIDGHGSPVSCLCFSKDDRLLAVGTRTTGVWIHDVTDGMSSPVKHLESDEYFYCLCFSTNNERLLTQHTKGVISNWDIPTMTKLFSVQTLSFFFHAESQFCVGDKQFVSISQHERSSPLTLWNADTGVMEKHFGEVAFINGIDLNPERTAVAIVRGNKSILVFDLLLEAISYDIAVPPTADYCVCRYVDTTQLITGGHNGIVLWDVTTQTMLTSYSRWYSLQIAGISVLAGTRYMACDISVPRVVVVVNIDSGEVVWSLDNARGVAFSSAVTILL